MILFGLGFLGRGKGGLLLTLAAASTLLRLSGALLRLRSIGCLAMACGLGGGGKMDDRSGEESPAPEIGPPTTPESLPVLSVRRWLPPPVVDVLRPRVPRPPATTAPLSVPLPSEAAAAPLGPGRSSPPLSLGGRVAVVERVSPTPLRVAATPGPVLSLCLLVTWTWALMFSTYRL